MLRVRMCAYMCLQVLDDFRPSDVCCCQELLDGLKTLSPLPIDSGDEIGKLRKKLEKQEAAITQHTPRAELHQRLPNIPTIYICTELPQARHNAEKADLLRRAQQLNEEAFGEAFAKGATAAARAQGCIKSY